MSVLISPKIINNDAVYGEIVESSIEDNKIALKGSLVYGLTIRSLPHPKYVKIPFNNISNDDNNVALEPDGQKDNNSVVSNLKNYANTLICLMVNVKPNPGEMITIISPSQEHRLINPFIHWILKFKSKPLVYCISSQHKNRDSHVKNKLYSQTENNKIVESVEDIQYDVLDRTSNIGVPCVIVLPPCEFNYSLSENSILRLSLSILGVAGKLIWLEKINEIDSCECQCAYSKNLTIAFYNSDVIWNSGSHSKICQYAIKESVNYLVYNKNKK